MYAILPAAGSGSRMGGLTERTSKILLSLGPHSVLESTLRSLVAAGCLKGVAVACRAEDVAAITALCEANCQELETVVVVGGETRQDSVYACLLALEGRAQFVLIHDAARPFCPPELISTAADVAVQSGACLVAVPAKSSLKRVSVGPEDCQHTVLETVPRADVWEAQTPQVFSYQIARSAHEQARTDGFIGTDDSELVERLGIRVRVVPGSDANLKITTAHDLAVAEQMLRSV